MKDNDSDFEPSEMTFDNMSDNILDDSSLTTIKLDDSKYWAGTTNINTVLGATGFDDMVFRVSTGDALFENDVDINGKLRINGVDIAKSLTKIEERLAILHPNSELESRWDELKRLREEYIRLETEIKEKEQMFQILKK